MDLSAEIVTRERPGRRRAAACAGCRFPPDFCTCGLAPGLALATRVVVLMHVNESVRFSNTGRFATAALTNAETRIHGRPHVPPPVGGIIWDPACTLVLYPGRGAKPLSEDVVASLSRPVTLVVPDGNWNQASHMMRRIPELTRARVVELPSALPGLRRMRRNLDDQRMSTFEAIALTLGLLEGDTARDRLLDYYRRVSDRMLMLRGKIRAADVHGGLTRGPVLSASDAAKAPDAPCKADI